MGFKCGKFPELTDGGNISFSDTGYIVHTFTSSGTFTNSSSYNYYVDILVVGGGGGSGYSGPTPVNITDDGGTAGGGGAGSVLKRKWQLVGAGTTYPVIIGSAGNSETGINQEPGSFDSTPGGDTIFNSPGNNGIPQFRAPGGAKGAESINWIRDRPATIIDNPLGSGGGGSAAWGVRAQTGPGKGANVSGFGFDGGNNGGDSYEQQNGGAGGGGGAGSAGIDGGPGMLPSGGLGGEGLPISDFTGNPLDYAGVGGGGSPVSGSGPSPSAGSIMNSAPRHPQDINSPTHYGRGGSVGPNNNRQAQDGVVIVKLL